jgi:hypothetical protein
LVAVDPGVRSILTAVHLDDEERKPFRLSQGEYRDRSMLQYKMKVLGSRTPTFQRLMGAVQTTMASAPSSKTVRRFDDYLAALGSVWVASWDYHVRKKLRKVKFVAWKRREKWMDKLTNRFKTFVGGENPTVLFGNGADSGMFGRLRGCGVKGPVLELKRRLAEKMVVVECDEYRTSKLCLDCGREAKFPFHGVTYCSQQSHHRMQNRDVAAAFKIGARYLAATRGTDPTHLGPWSRSVRCDDMQQMQPCTLLKDALSSYRNGTFTPMAGGSNVPSDGHGYHPVGVAETIG